MAQKIWYNAKIKKLVIQTDKSYRWFKEESFDRIGNSNPAILLGKNGFKLIGVQ